MKIDNNRSNRIKFCIFLSIVIFAAIMIQLLQSKSFGLGQVIENQQAQLYHAIEVLENA